MPGDTMTVSLNATDSDDDPVSYSINSEGPLPRGRLAADGTLSFSPSPEDIGIYDFQISVTDGVNTTTRTVTLDVQPDAQTTTRISGVILNTLEEPLIGVPIELGGTSTITASDGSFMLETASSFTDDVLKVRGEAISGEEVYPFIAEKLHLLFEAGPFDGVDNVIARPIYLPELAVAAGTTIDPVADTMVEQEISPGSEASVFVKAGSLEMDSGDGTMVPFDGVLSITEVPRERTPAAIPPNLFPDTIVTIQPGEMVFTEPAPLTLPNRGGYAAGTELDLWSIDPVSGEFVIVGMGKVSEDGTQIETISGGIRNSSWHLFNPDMSSVDSDSSSGADECGDTCPLTEDSESEVELYSGAYIENHELVSYHSQGQTRGITLRYESLWADPRPILDFQFDNVPGWVTMDPAGQQLVGSASVTHNGVAVTPIYNPRPSPGDDLTSLIQTWDLPQGETSFRGAFPAQMIGFDSGVYDYQISAGFVRDDVGATVDLTGEVLVVNESQSFLGAGWTIEGLQKAFVNSDDSVLLVDGNGAVLHFESIPGTNEYNSPVGDFSSLLRTSEGFTRTLTNETVFTFDSSGLHVSTQDRNGNRTVYEYSANRQLEVIRDPVNLETRFTYGDGFVEITDPADRVTRLEIGYNSPGLYIHRPWLTRITDPDGSSRSFEYDAYGRLIAETNQRGNGDRVAYDDVGRVQTVTAPDGTEYQYQSFESSRLDFEMTTDRSARIAQVPVVNDSLTAQSVGRKGDWRDSTLDAFGQPVQIVDAIGVASGLLTRNEDNLPDVATSNIGFQTSFTYDDRGNVTSVSDSYTTQSGDFYLRCWSRSGYLFRTVYVYICSWRS